jgi:hypothetical protein
MKMKKEYVLIVVALLAGGLGGFMFGKHKYEAKTSSYTGRRY